MVLRPVQVVKVLFVVIMLLVTIGGALGANVVFNLTTDYGNFTNDATIWWQAPNPQSGWTTIDATKISSPATTNTNADEGGAYAPLGFALSKYDGIEIHFNLTHTTARTLIPYLCEDNTPSTADCLGIGFVLEPNPDVTSVYYSVGGSQNAYNSSTTCSATITNKEVVFRFNGSLVEGFIDGVECIQYTSPDAVDNFTYLTWEGQWYGSSGELTATGIYILNGTAYAEGGGNNAPVVDLNLPKDNKRTNNVTHILSYNYSDAEAEAGTCDLIINGSAYGQNASIADGSTVYIEPNASLSYGGYSWYVSCTDGTDITNSSARSLFVDNINPIQGWVNPTDDNLTTFARATSSTKLQMSCADEYLFSWNWTVTNASGSIVASNESINISETNYTTNDYLDLSTLPYGTYTNNWTCSDDHTAHKIGNYTVTNDVVSKLVAFNVPKGDHIEIKLKKSDINLTSIWVNKEIDRYVYNFSFDGKDSVNHTYVFKVSTSYPIYYRGNLYPYPAFVIASGHWLDFNLNTTYPVSYRAYQGGSGGWEVEIITRDTNLNFRSIGGLNVVNSQSTFYINSSLPTVSGTRLQARGATQLWDSLNLSGFLDIEKFNISINLSDTDGDIQNVTLFFRSTNGTKFSGYDSCGELGSSAGTIGNHQHHTCYEWLTSRIELGTLKNTSTVNTGVNQGDGMVLDSFTNTSNAQYMSFLIDEIYKPVFKDYPYNHSDTTFTQNLTGGKITQSKMRWFRVDKNVTIDADFYSVDTRVSHSTGLFVPTENLELYICDGGYVSGDVEVSGNCTAVGGKGVADIQDVNKIRFVIPKSFFTDNFPTATSLQGFKFVYKHHEVNPNIWYALQTSPRQDPTHNLTAYSTDDGVTWVNETTYKDLVNINWIYNQTTCFEYKVQIESSNNEPVNSSVYSSCWSDVGTNNAPTAPVIIAPDNNETISGTYTFIGSEGTDPDGDLVNTNITILYANGSVAVVLANNQSFNGSGSLDYDTTNLPKGNYILNAKTFEWNTPELLYGEENRSFTIFSDNIALINVSNSATSIISTGVSAFSFDVFGNTSIIDSAWIELTYPNGSIANLTMTRVGNDYQFNFTSAYFVSYTYGSYLFSTAYINATNGIINATTVNVTVSVVDSTSGETSSGGGTTDSRFIQSVTGNINNITIDVLDSSVMGNIKRFWNYVMPFTLNRNLPNFLGIFFVESNNIVSGLYVVRLVGLAVLLIVLNAFRVSKKKNKAYSNMRVARYLRG